MSELRRQDAMKILFEHELTGSNTLIAGDVPQLLHASRLYPDVWNWRCQR